MEKRLLQNFIIKQNFFFQKGSTKIETQSRVDII